MLWISTLENCTSLVLKQAFWKDCFQFLRTTSDKGWLRWCKMLKDGLRTTQRIIAIFWGKRSRFYKSIGKLQQPSFKQALWRGLLSVVKNKRQRLIEQCKMLAERWMTHNTKINCIFSFDTFICLYCILWRKRSRFDKSVGQTVSCLWCILRYNWVVMEAWCQSCHWQPPMSNRLRTMHIVEKRIFKSVGKLHNFFLKQALWRHCFQMLRTNYWGVIDNQQCQTD